MSAPTHLTKSESNQPLPTDALGRTQWLGGFIRTKTGASLDDTPELCPKCQRIIRGDRCPFDGTRL